MARVRALIAFCCAALLTHGAPVFAEIQPEPRNTYVELGSPSPHWVLYQDLHGSLLTSRYVLVDADTMAFKAHISTGQLSSLQISPDAEEIYVADTFLNGPAAKRSDVVSVYDTAEFSLQAVIELPENNRALMGVGNTTALIGGGRFLLVFNFKPGTSVTVIDTEQRSIVGQIATPGCSLLYPTGARGVSMLCGDGSMLTLQLDAQGQLEQRSRSELFFDPEEDPLMEEAVSIAGTWYFSSYAGAVHPVDLSGDRPVFREPWPLVEDVEPAGWLTSLLTGGKAGPWLPGGQQFVAAHSERRELYVLVHPVTWSQGTGDHVFPGVEVWVYDIDQKARVRRLSLEGVALSVYVTQDSRPLMLISGADLSTEETTLEVYDAVTGEFLREMPEFGDVAMRFHGFPVR